MASILALLASAGAATADEPRPALVVRLDHPDRQLRAVIDLFRNTRAAHPAAALAAWKRASREPDRLGKPVEALIAAVNPAMAEELRTLDGAELALWAEPGSGRMAWGAVLPGDDGTFAALATALVLSGGAAEAPFEGLDVDRVGPPGSALMARSPRGLFIGGSREGLAGARIRSGRPRKHEPGDRIRFAIDPEALGGSRRPALRRLEVILGRIKGPVTGWLGLGRSTMEASCTVPGEKPRVAPAIDPGWLEWLPSDRAAAAFALAIDPAPSNWDAAFRLIDEVDKVDPARSGTAPARLRLGLAARALGLRLDADLFPHLRGVVGWAGSDGKAFDRALLMFHLDDEGIARRIFDRIKPPAAAEDPARAPGEGRRMGEIEGRAFRLHREGSAIIATWGDGVLECSRLAREGRERSARDLFRGRADDANPALLGAIWAARVPGLIPAETPLSEALSATPPLLWSGSWIEREGFRVDGGWDGLDATIRRFLERIPLDPPRDQ